MITSYMIPPFMDRDIELDLFYAYGNQESKHEQASAFLTVFKEHFNVADAKFYSVLGDNIFMRCCPIVSSDERLSLDNKILDDLAKQGYSFTSTEEVDHYKNNNEQLLIIGNKDLGILLFTHKVLENLEKVLSYETHVKRFLIFFKSYNDIVKSNFDEKDNLLHTILDGTEFRYIAYNLDLEIIQFNSSAQKVHKEELGIDLEIGKKVNEIFSDEDFVDRYDNYYKGVLKGEKFNKELCLLEADGSSRYLEWNFYPLLDSQDNIVGILEMERDITKNKIESIDISKREALLDSLINSSLIEFRAVDKDFNILAINDSAKKNFKARFNKTLSVGDNLKNALPQDIMELVEKNIILSENGSYSYIVEYKDPLEIVEIIYQPIIDKDGNNIGYLDVKKDVTEIERSRIELKESETRFKNLIQFSPSGIVKLDPNGVINFASERVLRIFQLESSDVINKFFELLLQEDNRNFFSRDIEKLKVNKNEVLCFYKIDSEVPNYIEGLISATYNPDDSIKEYFISFIDVTRRETSKILLKDTKRDYEHIFKNISEAMILYDYKEEKIVEFNKAATQLLGYTAREMLSLTKEDFIPQFSDLYPGIDLHEVISDHHTILLRDGFLKTNGVFLKQDGTEVYSNVNIIKSYKNSDLGYLLLRDITAEHKYKKELREKNSIYEALILNSFEGVEIIEYQETRNNKIKPKLLVRNAIMSELLNSTTALMDNVKDLLTISPTVQTNGEKSADFLNRHLVGFVNVKNSVINTVYRLEHSQRFYDVQVAVRFIALDGKYYLIRNLRDITEESKQKEIINLQLSDLNTKNAELTKYINSNLQLENFAYIASHDLKAPIRSVLSFMQLLRNNIKDTIDEKNLRFVDIVLEASKNMQVLIDDLLSYSRINTQEVEMEEIEVSAMLSRLLIELSATINDKEASIVIKDNLPKVIIADLSRIRQVFQNLITNGMKFTKGTEKPEILISGFETDQHFQFTISDNGIGIEPDYLETIFLMFKKLHSENKYQGTGIGLSICKKVIEQHKGSIWVDSVIGEGSSFHFTIKKDLVIT